MSEVALVELANAELEAGNLDQALTHFSSALAINPRLASAWLGKGMATMRRCLRSDIKLPNEFVELIDQSLNYLDRGFSLVGSNELEELQAHACGRVAETADQAHEDLFQLLRECGAVSKGLHQPMSLACIKAAEWALTIQPDSTKAMKAIVTICWRDLAGFDYEPIALWGPSKVHYSLDVDGKVHRLDIVSNYLPRIQQVDSGFENPFAIESSDRREDDRPCFIATACCGHGSNEVRLLRDFRDYILLDYRVGKILVAFYYRVSPPIASWLHANTFARVISRCLIVSPLSRIAERLLKCRST